MVFNLEEVWPPESETLRSEAAGVSGEGGFCASLFLFRTQRLEFSRLTIYSLLLRQNKTVRFQISYTKPVCPSVYFCTPIYSSVLGGPIYLEPIRPEAHLFKDLFVRNSLFSRGFLVFGCRDHLSETYFVLDIRKYPYILLLTR